MKWQRMFFFIILFLPRLVLGQTGEEILTLDDCIQLALENNYELNLSRLDNKIARKNYLQSYSNILPNISVSYSSSKYERGPTSYIGGQYVGSTPFTDQVDVGRNYYTDVQVGQTIFDGGRWYLNIKRSEYEKKSSNYNFLASRQNVVVTVRQLYMDLLKQEELLKVRQQAVQRSQEQLERVRSMYEVGSVAQIDVYRSEVNLGNDRTQLLNQKNAVLDARQALNIAIGREPDAPLKIDPDVEFDKQVDDLDQLITEAVQNNPSLKSQSMNVKSAHYRNWLAKSNFLPDIRAYYSYQRRVPRFRGLYEDFEREYSWAIGFRISWNLFNGFSDYLEVQKANLNQRYAKERFEYDKLNLKARVSMLYNNLNALNEIIKINRTNLESAKEDYRLARERYRLGSGTLLDMREAQVNLANAEQTLVSAEYDSYITYAELQRALGELVDY